MPRCFADSFGMTFEDGYLGYVVQVDQLHIRFAG